ncbi:MAG TPA: threonine/serine exporter family protein [Bacillota bacterium]|nr:threonine/serine exporter family protein [Bacillota bacterium]
MARQPAEIEEIMELAMLAGEILLKNGAETYRVEDTVERIGLAGGMAKVEPYATITGLVLSLESPDGRACTRVRRIRERGISLNKVAQVNETSRDFAKGLCSVSQARQELERIRDAAKGYSTWVHILAAGIGSGCFAFLLGANLKEFFLAALAGALIQLFVLKLGQLGVNRLISNFVGGLVAAGTGTVAQSLLMGVRADQVIIGAIMSLVPGLALTNAVRDVIHEDLLSGLARGVEAALVSVAVAVGVSLVLGLWLGVS